ncbi:MAG: hypothetical protein HQK55_02995 [Deltaproteobacteria bacterium]|nr:hypothetical protein [Deltaproteobacteria bacterium]
MNSAKPRPIAQNSISSNEQDWLAKRNALLQALSQHRNAQALDPDRLSHQRDSLAAEVEQLEGENQALTSEVKALEIELSAKRRMAQGIFRKTDEAKRKMVRFSSQERSLAGEIGFLKTEKDRLQKQYAEVMKKVEANLAALDRVVRQVSFNKGEMESLVEKMEYLESQAPKQSQDLDQLEEKIAEAVQSIKDIYARVCAMDKTTKTIYYRKRKEAAQ